MANAVVSMHGSPKDGSNAEEWGSAGVRAMDVAAITSWAAGWFGTGSFESEGLSAPGRVFTVAVAWPQEMMRVNSRLCAADVVVGG